MRVIPAIDLQGGRCVRLLRGDFDQQTVYGDDPLLVARAWLTAGADLLHVVDLDGAREGKPTQLDLISRISAQAPVQLGGGLRTDDDVHAAFQLGAQRVVLGTSALDLVLVRRLVEQYRERIVVALDTRDGVVTTRGWTERSEWKFLDLARALLDAGVQRFLHTDVERDGALTSPNFNSLANLVQLGAPVIASGGVATLGHVARLSHTGAEAAIVGRALYEGAFTLQEAIAVAG
jgi:phosphoribosylformimino-5-aminoimidazole carboxamide ribotide isomerase